MIDYCKLYLQLFNGISDIIENMEMNPETKLEIYISALKQLQIEAEENYMLQEE